MSISKCLFLATIRNIKGKTCHTNPACIFHTTNNNNLKMSIILDNAAHNNTILVNPKKRKRAASLRVRFCVQQPKVAYTYSQTDYDRSGLFSTDAIRSIPTPVIVTLSVIPPSETSTVTSCEPPKKRKQPPKLKIDTSNIHGPLFFTSMTTNHQSSKSPIVETEDQQDHETRENTKRNRHLL